VLKNTVQTRLREGHDHLLRLAFTNTSVGRPLLSETIRRFDVDFNILQGRIDEIQGRPLGSLAVLVNGTAEKVSAAVAFLSEHGVIVEKIEPFSHEL
jgi:D-methionine transport system ATP-binding protein